MNPTAIDTRHPPRVPPAIARPIAPQIAATSRRIRNPVNENVMAPPLQICENNNSCDEEREIDYLICRECNTPCYIFEIEGATVTEALCQVCGNDLKERFAIGEVDET